MVTKSNNHMVATFREIHHPNSISCFYFFSAQNRLNCNRKPFGFKGGILVDFQLFKMIQIVHNLLQVHKMMSVVFIELSMHIVRTRSSTWDMKLWSSNSSYCLLSICANFHKDCKFKPVYTPTTGYVEFIHGSTFIDRFK